MRQKALDKEQKEQEAKAKKEEAAKQKALEKEQLEQENEKKRLEVLALEAAKAKELEEQSKKAKVCVAKKPSKPKEVKKTKVDIIEYIEAQTGISKNKSNTFLKFFAQVVKEELAKGKDVDIPGFGLFTTIQMPAKDAVNPQTNKPIVVPAHNQARLRFDDKFKDKFN